MAEFVNLHVLCSIVKVGRVTGREAGSSGNSKESHISGTCGDVEAGLALLMSGVVWTPALEGEEAWLPALTGMCSVCHVQWLL